MNTYAATCRLCDEIFDTGETLRPEDVDRLAAHLRKKHAPEVVSVRTWRAWTVRQYFRITVVSG